MRFPLYVRMLLWFLLNVVVLAAVFALVVFLQFGGHLSPLLNQFAGERLQPLAHVIHAELARTPREEWSAVLDDFSRSHQLDFILVDPPGNQIAGAARQIPDQVRRELHDFSAPPRPRRLGDAPPPPGPPDDFENGNRPPRIPGAQPPIGLPDPHRWPRFATRTENPVLYWVGFRLPPLPDRDGPPERPAILLVISPTLTGSGLFLNFWPWLLGGFGALALSALLWLPFVRSITGRLREAMHATGRIAEGHFDVRVGDGRRDELGQLAVEINRMAARLDGFVTGQKRFLGDIAHELCSPLARLQLALAILENKAAPENAAGLDRVREEAQEMSVLVNELLSFSKATLQRGQSPLAAVPLRVLAERVVRREAQGSEDFRIEIPDDLAALADADLLQRALANVIRNASRYAGRAGPILITGERDGDLVHLCVADSGAGVPEEILPKLFDPFFRADPSRTRETGGVGLGLSIVKTCVEACGGRVSCRNRTPTGLEVCIDLHRACAIRLPVDHGANCKS